MTQRKLDGALKTLSEKHGVTVNHDVRKGKLAEARFSIGEDGKGTIDIPPASKFRGLDHQASSIYMAISHANLGREAQRLVAAAPDDTPNQAAADRVAAYKLPPSKQVSNPAFAEAELVATYATLHETSGLGLNYNPPPTIKDSDMQERWAKKLAEPGGLADVDRQITRTTKLTEELQPSRQRGRFPTREQMAQPEQAGRSAQEIAARAAATVRHQRRTADDPGTPPPPGGPGTPGGGSGDSAPPPPSHAR